MDTNVFYRQGGKAGAVHRCPTCSGRGIKVTLRQLGPGMVQQMQSVCPDCRGEGNVATMLCNRPPHLLLPVLTCQSIVHSTWLMSPFHNVL